MLVFLGMDSAGNAQDEAQKRDTLGASRVLVVEDSTELVDVFTVFLNSNGYAAQSAASGIEALRLVEESALPFDMAIVDALLPRGITGFALADELAARGVRVVMMSGHPDALNQFAETRYPGLQKPFRLKDLLNILEKARGPAAKSLPLI